MLKAFNQKEIKKFDKELTDGKGNWKPIRVSKDSFYLGGDVDKVKLFIHESHQRLIEEVVEKVKRYITKNRHKVERMDRYVLDDLVSSLESSLENKE